MDTLLEELGYRINYETLRREYQKTVDRELTPEIQNWYDAVAPYIVLAYQAGCIGKNLTDYFHFLETALKS